MQRRGAIGEVGWIVGLIVAAVGAVYARPVLLLLVGLDTRILFVLGSGNVLGRVHCRLHGQAKRALRPVLWYRFHLRSRCFCCNSFELKMVGVWVRKSSASESVRLTL